MKIEFQRESFREIIEEEFVSTKFDAIACKEQLKTQARDGAKITSQFCDYVNEVIIHSNKILDDILQKSPFNSSTAEYKNLKISVLLTSLQILKTKKKLNAQAASAVLWHLPKSMANYTKILVKEFFTALKQEIIDCYKMVDTSEAELEDILIAATGEWYNNENQY